MISSPIRMSVFCIAPVLLASTAVIFQPTPDRAQPNAALTAIEQIKNEESSMKVQYLEIVTPTVDETCEVLSKANDVEFSDPIAELGNARTAELKDGGRIGVRAPMRETETPVVRPYILVEDIHAAVKAAENVDAEIAIPPMEIPGQGTFSIYILGGIEHGLWQLYSHPAADRSSEALSE